MYSIDTTGFNNMVQGLSQISGRAYEPVLKDQVGQLVGVCIKYTRATTTESIKQSVAYRNTPQAKSQRISDKGGAKVTVNVKKDSGRIWFVENGKKYIMTDPERHWSDERWERFRTLWHRMGQQQNISAKEALRSRGLTKSSWYQIAVSLGVAAKTNAPQYVQRAGTFYGKTAPMMGTGALTSDNSSCFIEIANNNRLLVRGPGRRFSGDKSELEGFGILQRAINSRAKAFEIEVATGVFEDLETRAKRYPGIFVTHASN